MGSTPVKVDELKNKYKNPYVGVIPQESTVVREESIETEKTPVQSYRSQSCGEKLSLKIDPKSNQLIKDDTPTLKVKGNDCPPDYDTENEPDAKLDEISIKFEANPDS